MKIVIAPDSFKESCSAIQAAEAIATAFKSVFPMANIVLAPMADGGEGTLECLLYHTDNQPQNTVHTVSVSAPLGQPIQANYGILNQTVIIEMAQASGLGLVSMADRNPLKASTFGTGELILDSLNKGYKRFIIGLGGSATCDAGMGALSALGIEFYDKEQQLLKPCGANLKKIVSINTEHLDKRALEAEFILAHDINNPILGPTGALVYAPQKGATDSDLEILNEGLHNFVKLIQNNTKHQAIGTVDGGGAAGGLAAGLFAFLNASLKPGAKVLLEAMNFSKLINNANLIITGEGKMDRQSLYGKAPIVIAQEAISQQIPVIAIVGKIGDDHASLYEVGIDAIFSIADGPRTDDYCKKNVLNLLTQTSINIARLIDLHFV